MIIVFVLPVFFFNPETEAYDMEKLILVSKTNFLQNIEPFFKIQTLIKFVETGLFFKGFFNFEKSESVKPKVIFQRKIC